MNGRWSRDIEDVLIKLRINSILRSKYHKKSYFYMNSMLKYFRLPVIILSSVNSVFLMSKFYLQTYICVTISLIISIISSIEMYLQIQKRMEVDLNNAKAFESIAAEITKVISLQVANRNVDGLKFLDDKVNEYNSLVDMSIVTDMKLHEKLLNLNLLDTITKEDEFNYLHTEFHDNFFARYMNTNSLPFQQTLFRRRISNKELVLSSPSSRPRITDVSDDDTIIRLNNGSDVSQNTSFPFSLDIDV